MLLITAGFYSKDMIIRQAYASTRGHICLWATAIAGALLTSMYTFLMVTLTFFGSSKTAVSRRPQWRMNLPVVELAVLSLIAGFANVFRTPGGAPLLSGFLESALPSAVSAPNSAGQEGLFEIFSSLISLGGILLIVMLMRNWSRFTAKLAGSTPGVSIYRLWFAGWGFDRFYNLQVLYFYIRLARINRGDVIDLLYVGIGKLSELAWRCLIVTQSGRVRSYTMGIARGAAIIIGLAVFQ
ncbi:MAG: hypothetical protein AB2L11_00390 [Syntrophobacteraceae bacterium]